MANASPLRDGGTVTTPSPDELALSLVLQASAPFMALLRAVRSLELPDAYVAAGAVRGTYWAHRHGATFAAMHSDSDVVFFDPKAEPALDKRLEARLRELVPGARWEVSNQAHVHTWYEAYTGVKLPALSSTVHGISLWPETATCVGARLGADHQIEVAAPVGLEDLFALRWRKNPACPDPNAFAQRLVTKRVRERWPLVQVVAASLGGHSPDTVRRT